MPAPTDPAHRHHYPRWRLLLFTVIFEADTPAGRAFDLALIGAILLSVAAVMLESVASIQARYGTALRALEWGLTLVFTAEYLTRLLSVRHPLRYAFSFFGLVDLLAILPTYLSLVLTGAQSLLVIRTLRLLRVFRVFKLGRYLLEADVLHTALRSSWPKIVVFLLSTLSLNLVMGALMYLIEGEQGGFTSIPRAVYWAIVTMTTVGYGDIAPQTPLGQTLAAAAMVMGYAIIAVPTGIVSVELAQAQSRMAGGISTQACPHCAAEADRPEARYCWRCGGPLHLPGGDEPPAAATHATPEHHG